ncbi:protein kibra-like isoform X2 [Haliotis rufescens]|uniref:protein kibra-like isoform X2 n=1 Tax=Haliotis rufescens TaxID=6454 RepID=UPI00201EB001|nr:protein kibra-like isoform X2 [Haliotis rufescens]
METAWKTKTLPDLKNTKFAETFRVTLAEQKLSSKTLQVNVWSIHPTREEECLGCAQVSLADFDPKEVSTRWYNILSFKFMQSDLRTGTKKSSEASQPSSSSTLSSDDTRHSSSQTLTQRESSDRVTQLLEASSAKLRKSSLPSDEKPVLEVVVKEASHFKSPHPAVSSVKEENSDESTIISSQTSTLTRNQGPEDMASHQDRETSPRLAGFGENDDEEDEDDEDLEEEDEKDYNEMMQEVLAELENIENLDDHFSESDESLHVKTCDAETNTEGDYSVKEIKRRPNNHHFRNSTIRRSQTFSPACRQQPPGYVCKSSFSAHLNPRTSLDLELDLQASHVKLSHLNDEITRLKELKRLMEDAKSKGKLMGSAKLPYVSMMKRYQSRLVQAATQTHTHTYMHVAI